MEYKLANHEVARVTSDDADFTV